MNWRIRIQSRIWDKYSGSGYGKKNPDPDQQHCRYTTRHDSEEEEITLEEDEEEEDEMEDKEMEGDMGG
jgi:hypothetical protein